MTTEKYQAFTQFRIGALLVCVGLWAASPAVAQSRCTVDETLLACWQKYLEAAEAATTETVATEEAETADDKLRAVDPGVDLGGLGTGSTLLSTLSRLGLTVAGGDSNDPGQDDMRVAVDFNFLLPGPIRERNGQLKVLVNTQPELFEPLKGLLPEDERDMRIAELEDQFGDLADYSVQFKYNWISPNWGRSFSAHQSLFAQLFEAVPFSFTNPELQRFITQYLDIDEPDDPESQDDFRTFEEVAGGEGEGTPGREEETFETLARKNLVKSGNRAPSDGEVRLEAQEILRTFEKATAIEEGQVQGFKTEVEKAGLSKFAQLVNNQPQLFFSAERRLRDQLVGTHETRFELRWERPFGPNINRLQKSFSTECVTAGACPDPLNHYSRYLGRKPKKVDNADRAFLSVSYTHIDDYSINRPNDGLVMDGEAFTVEGGERVTVQAGFGRSFQTGPESDSLAPTRLDLSASYEDVFDDPERQNRFLANLTYTVKMGKDLSIPISFIYANKPEFLAMEDLDHEFSARFGLKFTVPGDKPKEKKDNGSN